MSADTADRTPAAMPDDPSGDDVSRTRWAPDSVTPMAVCLTGLFALPRIAPLGWFLFFGDTWPLPPDLLAAAALLWLLTPLTLIVLLISMAGGGVDALDIVILGLAVVSDALTWAALRFERRHGRTCRAGRLNGDDNGDETPAAERTAFQQWLDLLALGLPWPGMRLQAILRRWPRSCRPSPSEARLLQFLTYDSTVRSICFASPAWITGVIAVALVSNAADEWPVRMAAAAVGPIVTVVLIVVVGSRNAQFRVVLPIVAALQVLYCNGAHPLTTLQVRRLNRSIQDAADALQRLPVRLRSTQPTVVREAAEKAAAMSALQELTSGTAEPIGSLTDRLRDDMRRIVQGRWRTLPGRPADSRVQGLSRWQKAGLVTTAAALFATAAWVGSSGVLPVEASGPIIAALVGLAMAALVRSGVAPGGLQQAIDLGKGAVELSKSATRTAGDEGQSKNSR